MSRSLFLINSTFIPKDKLVDIIKNVVEDTKLEFREMNFPRVDVYKGVHDLLEIYFSTENEFKSDLRTATFGEGHGHLFMIAIGDREDGSYNKSLITFLKGLVSKLPSALVYNEEASGIENVRLFSKSAIESLSDDTDYYEAFYKA